MKLEEILSLSIDVTVTRSYIGNTNWAAFAYFLKSATPSGDKPSLQILCMHKCCKGSPCSESPSVPGCRAIPVAIVRFFQEGRIQLLLEGSQGFRIMLISLSF